MLRFLPAFLRGSIAISLYALFTLSLGLLIFLAGLIKLIPIKSMQRKIVRWLHHTPEYWTRFSQFVISLTTNTRWKVYGLENMKRHGHYLMISNHRSWLDILVLQKVFAGVIPSLRFFMKKQLLWQLPIIGLACKLLGFPFMERYSKEFLQKHPELRGKDIEATHKACEQFRHHPVTMINFIEGGRFSKEKHQQQASPYKYLLKPRAGGIAFVLASMGDQLEAFIDVTIIYPNMQISFWDFLCGKVKEISVYVHTMPIKQELLGDYQNDDHFRSFFQYWLNELWAEKDKLITNKFNAIQAQEFLKKDILR